MAKLQSKGSRLKDKKIKLYKLEEYKNELGSTRTRLVCIGTVWAYYRQLSASEYYEASKANIKEELFFEINWRNDLEAGKAWIKYRDHVYKVIRIDDYEGYKTSLRLYVQTDDDKEIKD